MGTWAVMTPEEQAEGELNCWRLALLIFSVGFFVGSWVVDGLMFKWFNAADSCGFPIAIIVIALLGTLCLSCFSLKEAPEGVRQQGSLLSSAVVTLTITFTTFDALYNHPSTCNSLL